MLKKTKQIIFSIEQRVPYIPNFSEAWTVLKVLLVAFLLCVIYSFSQVDHATDFYQKFIPNIKTFAPYVLTQLLLLISFSKLILRQKPFFSILVIMLLNLITVYLVHSISVQTFSSFFDDMDAIFAKFCVSFGILFFFLMYFDWRQKNIDPAHTLAKLIFLQSKMRPHFLFNTLNSVISLMKKQPDIAKKMLLNLSALLRASLKDEEVSMYAIEEEVTLCKKYLEIEKIRLDSRLEVEWEIDESILKCLIPRLCLQPLIENSVLHGIQHLENGGKINISIKSTTLEKIIIEIKNPVGKRQHYNEDKHNNISMENLKERLKIYFSGDTEFKGYARNGFYHILLIIPQRKMNVSE